MAVGLSGILLVMATAPNTLQLLGKFGLNKKRFNEQARSALTRLAHKGYIVFEQHKGQKYARITPAGSRTLAFEQEKVALASKRKQRWDRRYRMVIFDIPERKRSVRAALTQTMRESGFLCIQKSVWIHAYDCEDLIALLKADLHLGKDVVYTIVEKMENDAWVRRHFNLPLR